MPEVGSATVWIGRDEPDPSIMRGAFAEIFRSLDAGPRRLKVKVMSGFRENRRVAIDLREGEPIFCVEGRADACGEFRGRWLADHEVPLELGAGVTRLVLEPAGGNRIRVRRERMMERFFG